MLTRHIYEIIISCALTLSRAEIEAYTHVQNWSIKFRINLKFWKQSEAMYPSQDIHFSERFRVMFKSFWTVWDHFCTICCIFSTSSLSWSSSLDIVFGVIVDPSINNFLENLQTIELFFFWYEGRSFRDAGSEEVFPPRLKTRELGGSAPAITVKVWKKSKKKRYFFRFV